MTEQFTRPDWSAPLDVAAELASIPLVSTTKGMFFHGPLDQARGVDAGALADRKYVAFKDYTVREHAEVLAHCAQVIYPDVPIRQGLRQLGSDAYQIFVESMVGKVIFSVAARQWESAVRLVGRAYGVAGNIAKAHVEALEEDHAVVRFEGVFNFSDSYHVGVLEGAMKDYDKQGEVLVRPGAPGETTFKLTWRA